MRQALQLSLPNYLRGPAERVDKTETGLRWLIALFVRSYLRMYHRLQIDGIENLPRTGSFVMVANHASHLDALCLLSALPLARLQRTFPAAAQDYFCTGFRRMALSFFVNAIPFSRRVHIRQSLGICRRLLDGPDNTLILFPEGTRSANGSLGEFRPGIGSLVAGTNIPVVPCAIHGTFQAFPKGGICPRPSPLRLIIGRSRRFSDLAPGRPSHHHIANELHDVVGELLCK